MRKGQVVRCRVPDRITGVPYEFYGKVQSVDRRGNTCEVKEIAYGQRVTVPLSHVFAQGGAKC